MYRERSVELGIRWTIGDVSDRGFEALRLSVWGAWRLFGRNAAYVICVNSLAVERARRRTGELPAAVWWRDAARDLPATLEHRFDENLAEGVGWKLAPPRLFPDRYELSLDNDCILWSRPAALDQWLAAGDRDLCLMAEDVQPCFGQFAPQCGPAARNAGIRGLPPGFDLEDAIAEVLRRRERQTGGRPVVMDSELDEQGLQTAALSLHRPPLAVSLKDVTVCSPFPPHLPRLGRCGAHFVGLNARHIPWNYYDRPADACIADHWRRHRQALYDNVGLPLASAPEFPHELPEFDSLKNLVARVSNP